ncbi:MAG: glycine cleavage system aminomethyltransferase GcvT [Microbacteriaceae bacterium]
MSDTQRLSPLNAVHQAAGASFTDFAGWLMPVRYSSDLAEHHAVRDSAGIFDLSHMAEISVTGPEAGAVLDFALAGTLSNIPLGRAKYSLLLAEDGGILDDLVVYRLGEQEFMVVANAGNRFVAANAIIERAKGFDAVVDDRSDTVALIAIQGPNSAAIVAGIEGFTTSELGALGYYRCQAGEFRGHEVIVARTGYTGEDGFELYIDESHAAELWDAAVVAGDAHGLVPCGLACRDTLRLEAGMPLYGHELNTELKPAQVGAARVVDLSKDKFVGRAGVEAPMPADARVLVGLQSEGKRAGRAGYAVQSGDSTVGEITSGALSPTLGYPIAFALVEPRYAEIGTALTIDVRGTAIPATVVTLPFYSRKAR